MLEIYGAEWCDYCQKAKELLSVNGIDFKYKDVDIDEVGDEFLAEYGKATLPQIKSDGKRIGGYSDLVEYFNGENK